MNVPDDWGNYYYKCDYCGSRYHASEGGCDCLEDCGQCEMCMSNRPHYGMSRGEAEGWHRLDDLTELNGRHYCEEHYACGCCGEEPSEEATREVGDPWCNRCADENHWCPSQGPLLDHIAKKVSSD